ncbi:MAG TPA: hypothetical protein ENK81_02955 [Euryarchaeota archaeon]|nr:hypothetical protein [Euryarchaeota archaeon]
MEIREVSIDMLEGKSYRIVIFPRYIEIVDLESGKVVKIWHVREFIELMKRVIKKMEGSE